MTEKEKQEEAPKEEPTQREKAGEAKEAAQPEAGGQRSEAEDAPAGKEPAEATAKPESEAEEAQPARERPARAEAGERQPKEREIRPAGPPTAVLPPAPAEPGTPVVSRRGILRVGFWSALGAILAGSGFCGVDLLYPRGVTGFGGVVSVDAGEVPSPGEKVKIQRGRFWLVNLTEEQGGPGLLALWWKCPHLGCTVPWRPEFIWPDPITNAPTQGWFRCPCHGSTYTDAGVRVFGPAPRSMDTMKVTVDNGRVSVDTGDITNGAPDNPGRTVRL